MTYNFLLRGGVIPRDHGYVVLSALSKSFPFLHGRREIQIAPIRGTIETDRSSIRLDPHSRLHIRGLTEEQAHQIGGSWMLLGGGVVGIGDPTLHLLEPSDRLVSQRVVLRDVFDPAACEEIIRQQVGPGVGVQIGRRSSLKFKGQTKVGYSVHLSGLTPDVSLRIQEQGMGLCTSMGCGVFYRGSLPLTSRRAVAA